MDTSETFLKLVSSKLCHGESAIVLGDGPSLQCITCHNTPIPDVYDYICSQNREPLDSCRLAQAYYAWTGDEETPVSFILIGGGDGILSARIERQLLSRLRDTVLILEAVNAPFLTTPGIHEPGTESREYTEKFAANYVKAMEETADMCKASIPRNTHIVLNQIMKHMHTALENSECPEMFKYYFEKLVPFVKHCNPDGIITGFQSSISPLNWAHRLVLRMEESQKIRHAYSQFSIPFDVMFVMLGCYVSNVNVDVVSNWMFDLMTRICNGQFFWKQHSSECISVKALQGFMSSHFDRRRNTKLYYVLREIYRGNAAESLSSFLPQYAQIDKLVREKFRIPGASESLVQVAIMHFFPSVLFGDPAEHYAFTIALAHVATHMDSKTGQVVKGTYSKARTIYRTLKKFFQGVKRFSEIQNCWTKDTLDQFFVYESELQDEILALAKLLVLEVEGDDDGNNKEKNNMDDKETNGIQNRETNDIHNQVTNGIQNRETKDLKEQTTTSRKRDVYKTYCTELGGEVGGGLVEMQGQVRQDVGYDNFEKEMDIEESMDM